MAEDGLLHTAELIKTALPYVDIRSKLILDLLVKLYELIACLRNIRSKDIAACGFENANEKVDLEALLKKIRPNCNQKERVFIDKILNIFQAKKIFEMYNTYMEVMNAMEGFDGFSGDDRPGDNAGNVWGGFSDLDLSAIVGNDGINAVSDSGNISGDDSISGNNIADKSDLHINMSVSDNIPEDNSTSYDNNSFDYYSIFNSDNLSGMNNKSGDDSRYVSDIKSGNDIKTDSDNKTDNDIKSDGDNKSGSDNSKLIEALKAMIPPEQMETFENLRMLFDSMSYDDNKNQKADGHKE